MTYPTLTGHHEPGEYSTSGDVWCLDSHHETPCLGPCVACGMDCDHEAKFVGTYSEALVALRERAYQQAKRDGDVWAALDALFDYADSVVRRQGYQRSALGFDGRCLVTAPSLEPRFVSLSSPEYAARVETLDESVLEVLLLVRRLADERQLDPDELLQEVVSALDAATESEKP